MSTANWITLALGLLASAIAIGSVIVALRANARSTEANRIAVQSLAAQEQVLPPAWSAASDTEPNKIGLTNQSGRHIVIEKLDVEPESARRFVRLSHHLPTRVEYGDVYEFVVLGAGAEAVVLTWHFEGHSTIHSTERLL
ncbi:MAG: hypothetical protein V4479_03835 [Actinomycetota bacterium]